MRMPWVRKKFEDICGPVIEEILDIGCLAISNTEPDELWGMAVE